MRRNTVAVVLAVAFAFGAMGSLSEAHPGKVRRIDCTHVDRNTGERHRHTRGPYCNQIVFLSPAWMHH